MLASIVGLGRAAQPKTTYVNQTLKGNSKTVSFNRVRKGYNSCQVFVGDSSLTSYGVMGAEIEERISIVFANVYLDPQNFFLADCEGNC